MLMFSGGESRSTQSPNRGGIPHDSVTPSILFIDQEVIHQESLLMLHPEDKSAPGPESQSSSHSEGPDLLEFEHLQAVIGRVESRFAPVWPLEDYVAVNPFLGMADQTFMGARRKLRSVSEADMLLPLDYYRHRLKTKELTERDISDALAEIESDTFAPRLTLQAVLEAVQQQSRDSDTNVERTIHTLTQSVDQHINSDWSELVRNEVGRHCATHYDRGQAEWSNPWKHGSLYKAWHSAAKIDRRMDTFGLPTLRRLVSRLPDEPEAAVSCLLQQLNMPESQWEEFLFCIAHTVPGWSSWTRYQSEQAERNGSHNDDFKGLLAICLAYDVAVAQHTGFKVDWQSVAKLRSVPGRTGRESAAREADVRFVLLRASELATQRQILSSIVPGDQEDEPESKPNKSPAVAQMVFCIDVRSERIRRHIENASESVETFGFAGFFGVPIAVQGFEEDHASPYLPALLSPSFVVQEDLRDLSGQSAEETKKRRRFKRFLQKSWKQFSTSAVSCFGFVETSGLAYGWKLVKKTIFGESACPRFDGISDEHSHRLGPNISQLEKAGVTAEQQIGMAESILRGIGITTNFANVVIFCGHRSSSQNNPLQAGLDCGACCGHSGEPNARFAAKLLNQQFVRDALRERGISIPQESSFCAAIHDTTTDEIQFFDTSCLPLTANHAKDHLKKVTTKASQACRLERMPTLQTNTLDKLLHRAKDWSEVRPEWGLAGNSAFIVAPRSLTASADLSGRSFLHSYDYRTDSEFQVLEQIMTAPMVVAQWINMQYYASAVDNKHFGSGTKTVHNVVGQFGVHSGNGGDLTTGLAWESLHDGQNYTHEPLRLMSLIAAPRDAVGEILDRHDNVRYLVTNGWLNLVVIDEAKAYRYTPQRTWQLVEQDDLNSDEENAAMAECSV